MINNSRRKFLFACSAATMLLGATNRAEPKNQPFSAFERVLLVDSEGEPLNCDALQVEQEYVFFYPFASTPCFLLKLGKPTASSVELRTQDGRPYTWLGGIGPDRSIVAFSAICSHKMTHPAASVSFIGYRREPVGFLVKNNRIQRRKAVIQCCSEHSIYDPAHGARVLSGPAPQPLATIALTEEQGRLYATGVHGGDMFEPFFERFGFRLALEFGEARVRQRITRTAAVLTTDQYTRRRIQC